MRNSLFLIATFLLFSCAKEEFAANKGNQQTSTSAALTVTQQLCAQSTLVSPKVDILMLWDNSSSSIFINSSTKSSYSQLIQSVSEKFDYHILSAPLVSTNSNTLSEASLVAKDSTSVSGSALSVLRSKDQAASALAFSSASGSQELGIDRVASIIQNNTGNGIFRTGAYTIVVVMSNGDDTGCEKSTGYTSCASADINTSNTNQTNKLLCLRGYTYAGGCSGTTLNSTMMRFINISALTSCSKGDKVNTRYRDIAKNIYNATYTNGWPAASDNFGVTYPDSYNICSIDFNHIFDGVNSAIQQTLIKHKYDFWPVAGTNDSVDADTIRAVKVDAGGSNSDLTNITTTSGSNGFKYIGNQTNHSTRYYPTAGEPYTGKMIQLYGSGQLVYPECLKVTYTEVKTRYGFIYLKNGEPYEPTIEIRINGNVVPKNSTNGWDYMGVQFVNGLDTTNYKILDYPYDHPVTSGYFIRLNGTAQFTNSTSNTINVYYTSKSK